MRRLIPYSPEHLVGIAPTERITPQTLAVLAAQSYHLMDFGFTLLGDDGKTLVCAGVFPFAPGIGEAWMMARSGAGRWYTKENHRRLQKGLREAADRYYRIQASHRADNPRAGRWLRRLGFQKEGVMRHYEADGTAHVLMRYTQGEHP